MAARPGAAVRLRGVNTDNATLPVWSSGPVVVAAIDGNEVNQPSPVAGQVIRVAAGGRVDLLGPPAASVGVRIQVSKATAVIVSAGGTEPAEAGQPSVRSPMHLHGHRVLITARNRVAATGSPWWTDSFDVEPGETYDIVFKADNPGIWMDHCHNLDHARDGMVAHLAYAGITTPFTLGGAAGNEPE